MAGTRRRTGCLLIVVVLLAILCTVGAVIDRAVASAVESRLSDAVSENLRNSGTPAETTKVAVDGFPFLFQLVNGSFDGGTVEMDRLRTPDGPVDSLDLVLSDVQVPRDVLTGGPAHDITARRIEGVATLSVAELANRINLPGLTLASAGSAVRATVPVNVPLLGPITVTADVTPQLNGDLLHLEVSRVTAAGVTVPQDVVTQITSALGRDMKLDLPFAITLEGVSAADGELTVTGSATNVVLID